MSDVVKGLLVFVYKNGDSDCSLNGVSSNVESMILIGEGVPEIFTPSEKSPAIYLKEHMFQPIAVPKSVIDGETQSMYGGNFIYTSDSRFRETVNAYPIRVHDRIEG